MEERERETRDWEDKGIWGERRVKRKGEYVEEESKR